jgi:hypothetical protein
VTTFESVLAGVIADPESVTERLPGEPVKHWCARAVMAALSTLFGPDAEGHYNGTPASRAMMQNAVLLAQRERVLDLFAAHHIDYDTMPQAVERIYGETATRQPDASELAAAQEALANARAAASAHWDAGTRMHNQLVATDMVLTEVLDALSAALPVVAYVSQGRHYQSTGDPYPDAQARRAGALIQDATAAITRLRAEGVGRRDRDRQAPDAG